MGRRARETRSSHQKNNVWKRETRNARCHLQAGDCYGSHRATRRDQQRRVRAEEIRYGASDTEIKIGNTMPYSGPASAYGVIGKTEEAYFRKVNAEGGINGRKINFISYDDNYSPPKTVEQTRKLVESDEVLLIFSSVGTATNSAIQKYMNTKKFRNCSSPPAPPNGATRANSPGPWAGSPTIRAKRRSTPSTF